MIRQGEKAKLAILRELSLHDADWFDLSESVRKKYYGKDFVVTHFINKLEKDGLVGKRGENFCLQNKEAVAKLLSAHKGDVDRILSREYGRGDLTGQLDEQEKYVLQKILLLGNMVTSEDLGLAFSIDMDAGVGPFSGYSNAYGRERIHTITQDFLRRGFLCLNNDARSIPEPVLRDYLSDNLNSLMQALRQSRQQSERVVNENTKLTQRAEQFDPSQLIKPEKLPTAVPEETRIFQERAIKRFNEKNFKEAINDCYTISERLIWSLAWFLYPPKISEQMTAKDKIEQIWKDNKKETSHPGIRTIASLLYLIAWYKGQMSESPGKEKPEDAARTCIFLVLQVLKEFDRLRIPISGSLTAKF